MQLPTKLTDFVGATFLKRVSSAAEGMERKALICFSPLLFGLPFSWPVAAAASQLLSLAGPPRASRPKRPIAAERHFPINNIFVREIKRKWFSVALHSDRQAFVPTQTELFDDRIDRIMSNEWFTYKIELLLYPCVNELLLRTAYCIPTFKILPKGQTLGAFYLPSTTLDFLGFSAYHHNYLDHHKSTVLSNPLPALQSETL